MVFNLAFIEFVENIKSLWFTCDYQGWLVHKLVRDNERDIFDKLKDLREIDDSVWKIGKQRNNMRDNFHFSLHKALKIPLGYLQKEMLIIAVTKRDEKLFT